MKFNIGDRVRVIKILEDGDQLFFNNEDLINKTGKIVVIDNEGYPYGYYLTHLLMIMMKKYSLWKEN